jgi:hypothetical protein
VGLVLVPGQCRVCGCTDDHACLDGCAWADEDHTLCTSCVPSDDSIEPDDFVRLLAVNRP